MIVTIVNAKGRVVKTTSAVFLATAWTCRYPDSKAVILVADPGPVPACGGTLPKTTEKPSATWTCGPRT